MNYLFTTFEDYIKGNLSDSERVELEQLFKKDKAVKKDFDLFQSMRTQLSIKFDAANSSRALRENLESLGNKYFVEGGSGSGTIIEMNRKSYRPYLMSIAASLLFLMVVGFGLKQYANANYSSQAFASSMATIIPTTGETRSGSSTNSTFEPLPGKLEFYENDKTKAFEIMSAIDADSPLYDHDLKHLFMADASMDAEEYNEAIRYNKMALGSKYDSDAKWNLARTFLLIGDEKSAKTYLEELINGDDMILRVRSEEKLQELNSFMHWFSSF